MLPLIILFAFGLCLTFLSIKPNTAYAYVIAPDEIRATYTYTQLNDTECEVKIANGAEATIAYIPQKAIIGGKDYKVSQIALNGFSSSIIS